MANVPGTPQGDTLFGTSEGDTITGLGGDDTIVGFAGADSIDGGSGVDTAFYFDSNAGVSANLVTGKGINGSAQGDTFISIENLQGSNFNDTLTGTDIANELAGLNGADVLKGGGGADGLDGGSGDDFLKGGGGGDRLVGGGGNDTADYSLSNGQVVISLLEGTAKSADANGDTLTGIENITGTSSSFDHIEGDNAANVLKGLAGNDSLQGHGGADRLEGGDGDDQLYNDSDFGRDDAVDTLIGGAGEDLYQVGLGDIVIEDAGGSGGDKVQSWVSYRLPANVEVLELLSGANNATAIGNELNNTLIGNGSANILNGGSGSDLMRGGAGDDLYFVDHISDSIIEDIFDGRDRVITTTTYVLPSAGAAIELFTTNDSSLEDDINLIGNDFFQTIIGNSGDNGIDGRGGIDTLNGGLGNDTYYLADGNDTVNDSGGFDTISSTVSRSLLDHTAIERLVLDGAGDINGTGNALANQLFGSAGKNTLQGGLGADILIGRLGRDILTGGAGNDLFDFNAANETGNDANTRDAITDFTQGQDRIDLATIDANGALSGDAFAFIGAAAFTGVAGQLRFTRIDNANDALDQTIVEADMDGNATSDFQIRLIGLIDLTAGDFNL